MVWSYRNADCSLKINLLCHLVWFSAHYRSLLEYMRLEFRPSTNRSSFVASRCDADERDQSTRRVGYNWVDFSSV